VSASRERLIALLGELVAVDSTSMRTNAPVVELLERRLAAAGFECRRHGYQDSAGVQKVNLLARKGPAGEPAALALVGHTDCVPFDPAWAEALRLTERDGRLYGRGACDTKAFVACAVEAAARASALASPLLLVFTADEELGCLGAKHLVDAGLARARYAIVGEPTSLTPIHANKGYCLAEVEVNGKEGHSAYPDSGASAIFRAARFIQRLEGLARELRKEGDPKFDPPFTSINVGMIAGGRAKNVIAGQCRFIVEWRPVPNQAPDTVAKALERIRAELVAEEPSYEARIYVQRMDRGVDTPLTSEVVRFIEAESGRRPATVAFGTEAPHLTSLGAQTVVFGPGDIRNAHQTGEFVPIDELVRCEEILGRAIGHFCGPERP
jgi:acetylornithine deacetylase